MAMFDEITELLTGGDNIKSLSGALGGDEAATRTAATAAVPLLLGGMQKRTSSPAGAQALFDLAANNDGSVLNNVEDLFTGSDANGLGSTLVGSVLGGRRNDVEATLASSSGLSLGSIARFLPMVALLITGYLGRKQSSENLDRDGLSSALSAERQELEDVGFGQWLGLLDGGDPVQDDRGFQSGLTKIAGLGSMGLLGAGAAKAVAKPSVDIPSAPKVAAPAIDTTRTVTSVPASKTEIRLPSADTAPARPVAPASSLQTTRHDPISTLNRPPYGAEEEPKGRGWLRWLLPLLLVGLLGLLIWGCMNRGGDEDATTTIAPTVETEAPTAEADPDPTAVPTEVPTAEPAPDPTAVATEEPAPEPTAVPVPEGYIRGRNLATAQDTGVFNTLLDAIDAAGLTAALEADGPNTILAPIDSAFDLLPADLRSEVLSNPDLLAQVLSYHVIPGNVNVGELETGTVAALDGSELFFNLDGFQPKVNGATIIDEDLLTANGTIQTIDRVLIPPTLIGQTGLTVNEALSLDPIQFEVGSADLTDKGRTVLDGTVAYLASTPSRFEIGGHTDDDGSDEDNQSLSQARAETVLSYLVESGLDGTRFTAVGYGEANPIESNDTDAGKQANRRIEFVAR